MHELLGVVSDAVANAGADVSVHVGRFPTIAEPHAYVVIPHEYFQLTPAGEQPGMAERQRTIGFCVEHPGNATFEVSAAHGAGLGALFDINHDSLIELRRRGLPVERFALGYSPRWDAWGGDAERPRPIDITYMGTTDARRDGLLARQAGVLSRWDCRLLVPPHEQMTRPRQDFLMGGAKLRHLARSKVLINLHRGGSRSLEWVRVLEAMSNGCVVVSEQSSDHEPLVPGEHILLARPEVVALTAEALLRHPDRLNRVRRDAYVICRSLDMGPSAVRLLEVAEDLARGVRPKPGRPATADASAELPIVAEPPQPDDGLPALASWALALPEPIRHLHAAVLGSANLTAGVRVTTHPPSGRPEKSVTAIVVSVPGTAAALAHTLRSLDRQSDPPQEVLVVEGRTPNRWADFGPSRGQLLNAALERVATEYVLITETGHELFPRAISQLLGAIGAAHDAPPAVAHGMMADDAPGRLWNSLPLEPGRLARRAYLTAPLLLRQAVLVDVGGFSESPDLLGYEYHELLCRLVEARHPGAFVQEIVGRGPRPQPPAVTIAQLSPELTWTALIAAAPKLLRHLPSTG
ncbi:MAG: glycosyltransferase [Candidatus Dormibacteria bacterium]